MGPANSDVRVSYEIQSPEKIGVGGDMVSDVGKKLHGSMDEQSVGANELRKIGYSIHLFEPAKALEVRVGVHGIGPVDFKITNFNVTIH
jgi:hypothetical protein